MSFDRFQQILLVLLNIGHIHFGSKNTALSMNMIILLDAAAVREWRLVFLHALKKNILETMFFDKKFYSLFICSFYAATGHPICHC